MGNVKRICGNYKSVIQPIPIWGKGGQADGVDHPRPVVMENLDVLLSDIYDGQFNLAQGGQLLRFSQLPIFQFFMHLTE